MMDWLAYRDLACAAASAAAVTIRGFRRRPKAEEKAGFWDLVTAADRAAQAAALSVLRAGAPGIPIVAEEGADAAPASGLWWAVDPLDGTTNFVHSLPYYSTSVALVADGEPVAAGLCDVTREQVYGAARGAGAVRNRRPIRVDGAADLAQAVVSSRVATRRGSDDNLAAYGRVAARARAMRNLGSAALELAHVACGHLSAYWEQELHPWDYAAGILLVTEAGGRVTGLDGAVLDARGDAAVVSSNGRLHETLLALIQGR